MIFSLFSEKISMLVLFTALPLTVCFAWYFWGTTGAHVMLEKIKEKSPHAYQSNIPTRVAQQDKDASESVSEGENEKYIASLGQAGDLYGGINALFAALAFSGVAAATFMQARSLQISREQQKQQSFEPLFFQLLNLHKEVAAPRFRLRGELTKRARQTSQRDGEESGHDFQRAMAIFRRALRMKIGNVQDIDQRKQRLQKYCSSFYDVFYAVNQNELGPHFRTLFQVFKLIEHSNFDAKSKIRYANIARSTIGKDQLFLLAVNCISSHGADFKPLVEKYGLLKHIARDSERPTLDEQIASLCFEKDAVLGTRDRKPYTY